MYGRCNRIVLPVFLVVLSCAVVPSRAATFTGTLFYTRFAGGPNVAKVNYNYNDVTHSLTMSGDTGITQTPGADGIIFAPDGDLLVGGQGNAVYKVNPTTGSFTSVTPGTGGASFHLTLDPSGTKFYSSPFGGDLDIVPLTPFANGTTHNVTGSDPGLTQIAFAPNGEVFYVNGNPNGFGNVGLIDLTTFVTTRLYTSVTSAHGMVYDPFTGLITIFGAGFTGTIAPGTHTLKQGGPFNSDFDQGAVDGQGHAFIAGANSITFLDYSISNDITHPDFVIIKGGFTNIDDLAPLVGAGSQAGNVPEPATFAMFGFGAFGLGVAAWRRRRR